jgi:hypothetical protein
MKNAVLNCLSIAWSKGRIMNKGTLIAALSALVVALAVALHGPLATPTQGAGVSTPRWVYRQVTEDIFNGPSATAQINGLGRQGWESVGIDAYEDHTAQGILSYQHYVFKRRFPNIRRRSDR